MRPAKELCILGFATDENAIRTAFDKHYDFGRGPGQLRYGFFDRPMDTYFTELVLECDAGTAASIARKVTEEIAMGQ